MNYYYKYKKYKSKYYTFKQGGVKEQDGGYSVHLVSSSGEQIQLNNLDGNLSIEQLKIRISQQTNYDNDTISLYEKGGTGFLSNDLRISQLVNVNRVIDLELAISNKITLYIRIYPESKSIFK